MLYCSKIWNDMQIEIKGGTKTTVDYVLIAEAVLFMFKRITSKKNLRKVDKVTVSIVKRMDHALGDCYEMVKDGKFHVKIRLKYIPNFLIMLSTLAHEIVHGEQTLSGRLNLDADYNYIWNGVSYGCDPYFVYKDQEYEKLPWETEAYDNEESLAKAFISHYYEAHR